MNSQTCSHPCHNLTLQLGKDLETFNEAINRDPQFLAFTLTEHISESITFAIKSVGSDDAILLSFNPSFGQARAGKHEEGLFSRSALPSQWERVFQKNPEMPYQSFWGLYGQNIRQEGVEVLGDQLAFAKYAHIWRTMLEVLHDTEPMEDFLTGRYVFITTMAWGRCKIFYEQSGDAGDVQDIVFLHTAGSDIVFDLVSYRRSFLSPVYSAGGYRSNKNTYIEYIAAVIKILKLNKLIFCGISITDQLICLITLYKNCQLLWHIYSAQVYRIYYSDLDFYFNGWDGRERVETRYEEVNTPAMSGATARKIPGAQFKRMPNLGHFPATENPSIFVPFLLEAVDHITRKLQNGEE
ncbi:hypothetical protein BDV25DRAFT_168394 [Aspergillus avenaceus]|uniref:Alpha/Beta hydrolase protein n=1 Tax=Aspergillus avenaceus TaxID=36643 RepID=A0A5N6TQ95_ASPAV|nr:hypothetical protein BDV25DRAFT_168394 [Aspergillus avenaceus]